MHLLDQYCLATSSKISFPYILEKYFPLSLNNYIVFAPFSKPSKNFSFYQDVLDILIPILKENHIDIIQIGAQNEPGFQGCVHLQGQTSFNQIYHIIKKSLLYFGADTFAQHFSSALGVPSVVLISNNYSQNVRGYWNRDKQIILEPDRIKRKPSFSLDEGNKKQIDEIRPERIAESVCRLLNLSFEYPYETIFIGDNYINKILESVPSSVTDIRNLGVNSIVIRMDYEFNEQNLIAQMQYCPVTIVTNKPINVDLLKAYRPRVKQLFYSIEKDHTSEFAKNIQKLSIPFSMFSYLTENELNEFKLDYLDVGLIIQRSTKVKQDINELKDIPLEKLYYKSAKTTLAQGKVYPSKAAWLEKKPISNSDEIVPIIDTSEFWQELEHFCILKPKEEKKN